MWRTQSRLINLRQKRNRVYSRTLESLSLNYFWNLRCKITGGFRLKHNPNINENNNNKYQIKHSLYLLSDEDNSLNRDIISLGFVQHLAHWATQRSHTGICLCGEVWGYFFVWVFFASVLFWVFLGGGGCFGFFSVFVLLFLSFQHAYYCSEVFYMLDISCFHCYSDAEVDTT